MKKHKYGIHAIDTLATTRKSRIAVKGKTLYNIAKESILHPLRTSIIDTNSGDTINKK